MITAEEFETALAEAEAQIMVEEALSPEIRAAEEELRRALEGLGRRAEEG